ncbi:MAG TPA: hypothetical protein ENK18_14180, partial [Deltaproteobacteria bacterium]|nr:hypothetical protein [Deltaproteobacteria bacterium]
MLEGSDEVTSPGGAYTPLPTTPIIGAGRYALTTKIAEGGMAGVYRAWDAKLQVWRAVKVLLPEYTRRSNL